MPNNEQQKDKACHFCVSQMDEIDYKDINTLRRFINIYKKILPRKRTGTCNWHQRKLGLAVRRARVMALLPYTDN